jgi:hypothetical protein
MRLIFDNHQLQYFLSIIYQEFLKGLHPSDVTLSSQFQMHFQNIFDDVENRALLNCFRYLKGVFKFKLEDEVAII